MSSYDCMKALVYIETFILIPLHFLSMLTGWSQDYMTNDNDQAVVEICITRITTAIRETSSMERHGSALVALWESCLEHNLQPQGKDEDTPHAKIASDITSCILQVSTQAGVPVFLVFTIQKKKMSALSVKTLGRKAANSLKGKGCRM